MDTRQTIFGIIALIVIVMSILSVLDDVKKEKQRIIRRQTKNKGKKENYFKKRIYFVEMMDRAIKLSAKGEFEKSNHIYDELLSHVGDSDIHKYLDKILANKGFNYKRLGLSSLAKKCLEARKDLITKENIA